MSGLFADHQCFRRTPLAFALCLLAILFAAEAKAICYEPANCLHSNVQCEKALPADLPSAAVVGIPQISRAVFPSAILMLASIAVSAWSGIAFAVGSAARPAPVTASALHLFLPFLFLRPPPAL